MLQISYKEKNKINLMSSILITEIKNNSYKENKTDYEVIDLRVEKKENIQKTILKDIQNQEIDLKETENQEIDLKEIKNQEIDLKEIQSQEIDFKENKNQKIALKETQNQEIDKNTLSI